MFSPSPTLLPDWSSRSLDEGQLSVDVFRDGNSLVIRSTVAAASPEDLDISIHGDLLTIRGKRDVGREVKEDDWYYRECYWGAFSRSVVLPYEVNAERAEASLKNGLLEIRVPIRKSGERNIRVKVEE
ncbi:MAG TPA: Hsp20/alpha crystallin family protein [Candidatus Methylomirabilis sp.]|nr:Hsp20/alpha crystallin family protein [Candidatus Methylomirabilis sp.]